MPSATRSPTTSATETATTATTDSPPPNNDSESRPDVVSSPTKTQAPLVRDNRYGSLRVLAVAVVDVDGHQVLLALGGLELDLEADGLVGRDDRARLPDRCHRLPLVDLVGDADDRAREVVPGEERHVDPRR